MIWQLSHEGRVVFRGSYQAALVAAERAEVLFHVVAEETDTGRKTFEVPGRGFYDDGAERPPRLHRGWMLAPHATSADQARRVA